MDSYKDVLTAHTNVKVMMLRAINDNMTEENAQELIKVYKTKWRTLVKHSVEQLTKLGFDKNEALILIYANCYFVGETGSIIFKNNSSCEVVLNLEKNDDEYAFTLQLAPRY